jgi:hypothetical protein
VGFSREVRGLGLPLVLSLASSSPAKSIGDAKKGLVGESRMGCLTSGETGGETALGVIGADVVVVVVLRREGGGETGAVLVWRRR